jgi:hypothetical protein
MTTKTNIKGPETRAMVVALALGAAACGPTFDPPSLIEKTRVLGARVEVAGAPERAMPRPGEEVAVTWLLATPAAPPDGGWLFALCAPAPGGKGCAGDPLAIFSGREHPPRLSFTAPAAGAPGSRGGVLLLGRICAGAEPVLAARAEGIACAGGADGTTVSLPIPIAAGDETNHNPTADGPVSIGGQVWAAGDGDPCVEGPRVPAGGRAQVISFLARGDDRETYTALAGDPPVPTRKREALQLSRFATAGELDGTFGFVDGADARPETTLDVKWTPPDPEDLPRPEQSVTFTFVVRDGRGGLAWTTRRLCVTR